MTKCPVCEWTPEEGKTEEEAKNSVIAHMSSSKGEHEGIGFQKAKQMIWADEEINGTDNTDSDTEADSGSDSVESDRDNPAVSVDDTDTPVSGDEGSGGDGSVTETSDAGLGLSGANPFPDSSPDDDPSDADDSDADAMDTSPDSEASGIAVLGAVAAVGLALFAAISGRNSGNEQPEPEIL